jgi:antagonist of KipI
MTIRVVAPGAFTTVQDLGRSGFASAGVPPSGAMDAPALRAANLLAGNDEGAAGLEITLLGPTLHFEADATVALAGATVTADLDGTPVPTLETFRIAQGSTLRLPQCSRGVRAYLAIRGGIDVPEVLGSRSTLASAGLGGLDGRALKEGDALRIGVSHDVARLRRMRTAADGREPVVRVLPGPQLEAFTDKGRAHFFDQEFRVSPSSDRVGVRLEGDAIELVGSADIDPEGVVTGAIQVPGDGHPILLGPDRPVTGGYAKIATVIAADLGLIAQARPGDSLRFVEVTLDDARAARRERESALVQSIEDIA